MGDDKAGAPGQEIVQRRLDLTLGAGVHAAGRLVQDEQVGVGQRRAGDGQQLALPLAETAAPLAQSRLVPLGQPLDEVVGLGQLGRRDHLIVTRLGPPEANVVHHRIVEEKTVLEHQADLAAQAVERDIAHVHAVDGDAAAGHVVEAGDEVDQGGLARARRADDGHGLARLCHQVDAA